jgi:hypothetical protein
MHSKLIWDCLFYWYGPTTRLQCMFHLTQESTVQYGSFTLGGFQFVNQYFVLTISSIYFYITNT